MAINLLSYINTNTTGNINLISTDTNILVIDGYSGYITGAGTVNLIWTGYSGFGYNSGIEAFVIDKKLLTVIPDNLTFTGGTANYTYSISGFVYNQNSGNLISLPTGYSEYTGNQTFGTYNINVSGGNSNNYNFNYQTGVLTFTPISDPDAITYISNVESADNQSLEIGTAYSLYSFITGCKGDNIWEAIKSSCILIGARTLSGALVPLKGSAPTNYNFINSDYSRVSGLKGDGSTKYLDSNRPSNAGIWNNKHISVYITDTGQYLGAATSQHNLIGAEYKSGVAFRFNNLRIQRASNGAIQFNYFIDSAVNAGNIINFGPNAGYNLIGANRFGVTGIDYIITSGNEIKTGVDYTVTSRGTGDANINMFVFRRNYNPGSYWGTDSTGYTNARLSFYSMGDSIDLYKLNQRTNTLMENISGNIGISDIDALSYILRVENIDGQYLEPNIKNAINRFVTGCKGDNIWNSIKSSCILAGARSLSGALVPLKGSAPTNYNFNVLDYTRKSGLRGNGSSKYLDSNRSNLADPINSKHISIYLSQVDTTTYGYYIGGGQINASASTSTGSWIDRGLNTVNINSNTFVDISSAGLQYESGLALKGLSRFSSGKFNYFTYARDPATNNQLLFTGEITGNNSSSENFNHNIHLFKANIGSGSLDTGVYPLFSNARMSFYSIGEHIDLYKLNQRVNDLMSDFNLYVSRFPYTGEFTPSTQTLTYGDANPSFAPSATNIIDTGNIIYSSTNPSVISILNNTGRITGVGTADINWFYTSEGYNYTGFVRSITVNKKTLTVTPSNHSILSGQDIPALTVSYSGFVYNQNSSSLSIQSSGYTTGTSNTTGIYLITASGGTALNYDFDYKTGFLTVNPFDTDAFTYISNVETSDGTGLGFNLRATINSFVVNCKSDNIWNDIGSCCILAGARTLSGALKPLRGTAPTNYNFVSGDYNRVSGLKGDGSTKYLDSNRPVNTESNIDKHFGFYLTQAPTTGAEPNYMGNIDIDVNPDRYMVMLSKSGDSYSGISVQLHTTYIAGGEITGRQTVSGFKAASRDRAAYYSFILTGVSGRVVSTFAEPTQPYNTYVFGSNLRFAGVNQLYAPTNARIAFYTIGTDINLIRYNQRVNELISGIYQYAV